MSVYQDLIQSGVRTYREIGNIHGIDVLGVITEGVCKSLIKYGYKPLYSEVRSRIINSMVLSDTSGYSLPIQKAVEQVNAVLRGVDERYFSSIRFSKAEVDGDKTILYYVADGKGFSVGVVLGSNGDAVGIMFVTDNKQKFGPASIYSTDSVRRAVDRVGIWLSNK